MPGGCPERSQNDSQSGVREKMPWGHLQLDLYSNRTDFSRKKLFSRTPFWHSPEFFTRTFLGLILGPFRAPARQFSRTPRRHFSRTHFLGSFRYLSKHPPGNFHALAAAFFTHTFGGFIVGPFGHPPGDFPALDLNIILEHIVGLISDTFLM